MTHDQLTERRAQLIEQLQQHAMAVEQLKGALAFCDELLAAQEPDPHAEHIPELDGKPVA
jgi:hypothetical protein